VNVVIFTVLESIVGQDKWYFSNLPAILLAILFAYLTNRSFVFDSAGNFWVEMYKFFGARAIVSIVFEYGFSYLLFNIIGLTAKLDLIFFSVSWFKIIALVFVLVANYLVSKFFVFKTK
jgi:putative flippase GtrA